MHEHKDTNVYNAADGTLVNEIVVANRAGVEQAFVENQETLLRWLTKVLGDIESARDIAQATFVNVWKYCDNRRIGSAKALIFQSAINLARNELRRRGRVLANGIFPEDPVKLGPLRDALSEDSSPEELLAIKQEMHRTMLAIGALPRNPRRAFKMHRIDGLNYREIAEEMNVSESSIEKYMIDALRQLRDTLA